MPSSPASSPTTASRSSCFMWTERRPATSSWTGATSRAAPAAPSTSPTSGSWRTASAAGSAATCSTPPSSRPGARSEEHTSELQSLMRISYAVFCLKKNNHLILFSTLLLSHHSPFIHFHTLFYSLLIYLHLYLSLISF